LVAALLGDEDLAVYQVTINFFVYLQSLSGLVLMPFAKNMIRLPERVVWKVSFRLVLIAVLILAVSLPMIYWVLNHVYYFGLGVEIVVVGGLFVLPTFFYAPIVYNLIGKKREKVVLYVNLIGVLINFAFSYFLLLCLGIIGALIGTMISQAVLLAIYVVLLRARKN
jgi:O-antigen/teichoic acid export membrane protein